jgi:DNA topoisomerase-1
MQVAQKLYEGVNEDGGLITYMRTDGVYVAPEAVTTTRALIEERFGKNYVPSAARVYTSKAKNSQEAHEAIRPTDITRTPEEVTSKLESDMARLYELIWKRMVASQMESAVFDQVVVDFETADKYASLRANGSVVKFDGYQKVYEEGTDDEEDEESRRLPKMDKGQKLDIEKVVAEQHFTEPPPRYSEPSLVKRLEELGIGRPSTYASIISVLQDREYVVLDKKRFTPTERGRIVTAFLSAFFTKYVEFDYTAELEEELDNVSEGKMEWKQVLRDFWGDFIKKIEEAQTLKTSEILEKLNELLEKHIFANGRKCPSCADGTLGLKVSKFGAFIGCSHYPECNYTTKLTYDTEAGEVPGEAMSNEPRVLGTDTATGLEITVRKGPYGWYLQLGEETLEGKKKKKPKRFAIAKNRDPMEVTLEEAIKALALPREVGLHPETKLPILAGIGRFGPYLLYNEKYTSLKTDDVLEIGINRAVDILAGAAQGGGKGGFGLLKEIGEHEGAKITLNKGRYGPYIKYGKLNIAIPKGTDGETITLEEAIVLVKKKQDS